jgi:peptidoglycan/xylan/chitin deacetylase (PgdA/CDA1 family)
MLALNLLVVSEYKTPVLTYHDIIETRDATSVWFDCTRQEFEDQIQWLKNKKAVFISLDQLVSALESNSKLPKNAICITFADNYQGFYKFAWPILKRERIHVAQFVHTDFIGNLTGRPKMTWKQLKELQTSGLVTIGSQTLSHPADLTRLSNAAIQKEFKDSKLRLEKFLGTNIQYLAYPNGKYNRRVSLLAKESGYRAAFTEQLLPAESHPNLWEIPRYVHTKYELAWLKCR